MFPFHFPAIAADRRDRPWTKPLLIAILVLAAVLRLGYLLEIQQNPLPVMVSQNPAFDQYNYLSMAEDLTKNHWLGSKHPGHSPVYSYFIAAIYSIFGPDMNLVFLAQILYGVLAVYLFYRCAVLLFNNKTLGLLTAFVAAMYSPFLFYECELLRESLIAYTNLAAFYFFLLALRKDKNKNYILAGIMTGLSFILRAGVMPFFVLGYLLLAGGAGRKRWTRFALVLLGMAIAVTPLTLRNYAAGFKALTETSGPTLFWLGNSYDSPGIGLMYTPTQEALTEETQGKILKTIQVLWREMRAHPEEYKSLVARKFKMLFNGYEIPANLSYDLFKANSLVLKLAVFNFVWVAPLALLGLVLCFKKYKNIGLLYTFVFSLTAFVLIFHIQSRYRVPFIPFYILMAGYSIFWFWQMIRAKASSPLLGAVILLFPLVLFTWPDRAILDRYFNGGIRAVDYANFASAHLFRTLDKKFPAEHKRAQLEKAIFYYDRALAGLPDNGKVNVYITQAMVYDDLQMHVHAIEAIDRALAIDPENKIAQKEYKRIRSKGL